MSTRGFVLVAREESPFHVYYKHTDTYPTGLGVELLLTMKYYPVNSGYEIEEVLVERLDLHDENVIVANPIQALKVQADVEWIYAVRLSKNHFRSSVTIYKSSFPKPFPKDFIFPVWSGYVHYMPATYEEIVGKVSEIERTSGIVLNALEAYHTMMSEYRKHGFKLGEVPTDE